MLHQDAFTARTSRQEFHAILFDMDGTIIDSTQAVLRVWTEYAEPPSGRQPADHASFAHVLGVEPSSVLAASHGRRTIDTVKLFDPSKANWDCTSSSKRFMSVLPNLSTDVRELESQLPVRYGDFVKEISGARKVLEQMGDTPWAIVTSASRPLALGWFETMDLPRPKVLVSAEDVPYGKPDPACYMLGREKLGLRADAKVLVIEDAPVGIEAGKAAGCQVLSLATTHAVEKVNVNAPEWIVRDLNDLEILGWNDEKKLIEVEITNALTW